MAALAVASRPRSICAATLWASLSRSTLSGGQVSDVKGYGPVMDEPGPAPRVLLADKGYDADFILADLEARGVAAVIPAKRNRKVQPLIDGHIYSLRG